MSTQELPAPRPISAAISDSSSTSDGNPGQGPPGAVRRKRPTSRPPPPPIVDEVIRVSTRKSFAAERDPSEEEAGAFAQRTASFSSFKPQLTARPISKADPQDVANNNRNSLLGSHGDDKVNVTAIPEDDVDADMEPEESRVWFDAVQNGNISEVEKIVGGGKQDVNLRNKVSHFSSLLFFYFQFIFL